MDTAPLASSGNRRRPLIFLLLLLFVQLWGCEEKKGDREEARKEQKVPIGNITTTNYCQGVMTAADVKVKPGYIALSRDIEEQSSQYSITELSGIWKLGMAKMLLTALYSHLK